MNTDKHQNRFIRVHWCSSVAKCFLGLRTSSSLRNRGEVYGGKTSVSRRPSACVWLARAGQKDGTGVSGEGWAQFPTSDFSFFEPHFREWGCGQVRCRWGTL